jgi:hypothetical protein
MPGSVRLPAVFSKSRSWLRLPWQENVRRLTKLAVLRLSQGGGLVVVLLLWVCQGAVCFSCSVVFV